MMNLTFHEMKMKDLVSTMVMEQRIFRETLTFKSEMINNILYPDISFVSYNSNELVGFIKSEIFLKDKKGIIHSICISKEYRRLGIGKRLLDLSITAIKNKSNNKINEIYLYVSSLNDIAISFYKRYGFIIINKIERIYSDGSDGYMMKYINTHDSCNNCSME